MEFAPLELPGKDQCSDCGAAFDKASDDTIEERCPRCQAEFRIRDAERKQREIKSGMRTTNPLLNSLWNSRSNGYT